jgi:hypothetical protein
VGLTRCGHKAIQPELLPTELQFFLGDSVQGRVPLPTVPLGAATVHPGNVTHGVSVDRGERFSLIIFFFRDCEAQRGFFRAEQAAEWRTALLPALVLLVTLKWYTMRARGLMEAAG